MRRVSMLFAAAAAVVSITGCGGSSDSITGTNSGVSASFSASVGGVAWAAVGPLGLITSTGVTITGGDAGNATIVTIAFLASAPGTYSLTFGQTTGGVGTVAKSGGQAWSTVSQGGTGSVTLTTLTAHHAVGTFTFDAIGGATGLTNVLHVTNGKFDFTL
jgi:hypothetical protein